MLWVKTKTMALDDPVRVSLPDRLWRLLYEIDFLCGKMDGPIPADYNTIAWMLRKPEPQVVAEGIERLIDLDLLEIEDGKICPRGWLELNMPYLYKLEYNRDRRRSKQPDQEGEKRVLSLKQQQAVEELHKYEQSLRGLSMADRAALVATKMDELGVTFDTLWEAIPTGREGRGSVSQAPLDPNAPWRVWARGNTTVYQLPDDLQEVSYLLYSLAGFEPFGAKKEWVAGVRDLLTAAGGSMEIVKSAIEAGQRDRMGNKHLTFKGPRSYVAYARDVRSRANLADRDGGDVDANSDKPMMDIKI